MILSKLKDVSYMFLGLLEDLPDTEIGHATLILQELIQLSMLRLSKGKIQNVIFDPINDSEVVARNVDLAESKEVEEEKPSGTDYDMLIPSMLIERAEDDHQDMGPASPVHQAAINAEPEEQPDAAQVEVKPVTQLLVLDKQYVTQTEPNGEVVFICSVCMRKFKDKSNLMRHLRMHAGDRPYACSFCGRQFTQKVHCQVHERSHTGERPFPCAVCGKTFSSHRTLHKHRVVHTKEKPHRCQECGRGFAFRDKLAFHQLIHTGAMPYQCQVCQRRFRWPDSVKKHKCPGEPSPRRAKAATRRTKKIKLEGREGNVGSSVESIKDVVVISKTSPASANKSGASKVNTVSEDVKPKSHPLDSVASIVLKNNKCLATAIPPRKKMSFQLKSKHQALTKNVQKVTQQTPSQQVIDFVLAPVCDAKEHVKGSPRLSDTAAATQQNQELTSPKCVAQDKVNGRSKFVPQKGEGAKRYQELEGNKPLATDSLTSNRKKAVKSTKITTNVADMSLADGQIKTENAKVQGTQGIQSLFSDFASGTRILAVTEEHCVSTEPQKGINTPATRTMERLHMDSDVITVGLTVDEGVLETQDNPNVQTTDHLVNVENTTVERLTQLQDTLILDEHGNPINTETQASNTLILDEHGNLTLESLAALPQGVPIQIVHGEEYLTVNNLADIAHITNQGTNYVVLETFDDTQH